jgi:ubiquinone/menaquinone biosynthesis C-methylase UbiE
LESISSKSLEAITRRELREFFVRKTTGILPRKDDWVGKQVLDVGTGRGFSVLWLAGLVCGRVYSIEPFDDQLERAGKNIRRAGKLRTIKLVKGWAENLPCPNSYFDVVVTYGSLHDFKDVNRAFHEFNRVLKEGGVYAATEPSLKLSEIYHDSDAHYFQVEEIRKMLTEANFRVSETAESDNGFSFFVTAEKCNPRIAAKA